MKLTFNAPIVVPDLAILELISYTPNDKSQSAVAVVAVESQNDIAYQQYSLNIKNGSSTGVRANPIKAPSYGDIMELFNVDNPTAYTDITNAYLKNAQTLDKALGAALTAMVNAGIVPDGSVA